ncbi:MAG: ECF transporter S component [Oscillospiraceae bacterium]|nr:ECF transporter S component [Oscillospiraceae bacterium]
MKKTTLFTLLTAFVLIPATVLLGSRLPGRWYYLTSTLVIIEILIPFFLAFESRRPQARELVLLAVLCALAAASRAVVPLPNFKPIFGVIMIAGMAFGSQAGFLVGAVSAFASNFILGGQGPWTPWQMMAYGVAGLLAGAVTRRGWLPKKPWVLAAFGFIAMVTVVGLLLDCCTIFTSLTTIKWSSVLLVLSIGLRTNISHGIATAVTLLLFAKPLLEKLDRVKLKYGLIGSGDL